MPFANVSYLKRRHLPFTTKNALGQADTTTTATVTSSQPTKVRVAINPSNNREVLVDGISPSAPNGNTTVSVTCNGQTSLYEFLVPTPPDQSEVTFGTLSAEEDIPTAELP